MLNRLGALIYIFLFGLVSLEADDWGTFHGCWVSQVRLQTSDQEEQGLV